MTDQGPNQTLYLNNLPDRLSKDKLRRQLYNICSKFGSVLDIIVHPGQSMRGQAWVVFSSVDTATKAMNRLNGYVFFTKAMKAQFAKANSDVIAKLEGKFVARPRKSKEASNGERASAKRVKVAADDESGAPAAASAGGGHDSNNPPGPILKVDNIPDDVPKERLVELFSKYEGYMDLRHVPAKMLAFAEYRTTDQAKLAREGLRGHQITASHKLRVNFAKPRE